MKERRDWTWRPLLTGRPATLTRHTCHALHMALVGYGLLGWLVPSMPWLRVHLVFLPVLPIVWRLNRNTCPLNNLETWLTSGRWRDDSNPEEGGFLRATVVRYFDVEVSERAMNAVTYSLMGLAWGLSWGHLAMLAS